MKKLSKKIKILVPIIIVIIIAGTIIALTKGFNFDLKNKETKKIELYLAKGFDESDVKEIAKQSIPNSKVLIQKIEVYEDSVSITADDITEEQKADLINKINERYGTEISADETAIQIVPHTKLIDILKKCVMPFTITTIIVLVYICVRYYKLGIMKILMKTIGIIVLNQILLFSIIAITRIPIGRLTISMMILIYILTLGYITIKFENKLLKVKNEENKK